MKRQYKLLLIGFLTIGIFDVVTSIASKQLNFDYAYLCAGSFIIYCIFGFLGTKEVNLQTGVLLAAAIGLFDSTIGWEISMLLGANTGNVKIDPTLLMWIITAIFVTGLAALCGLIGGGLAKVIKRK
jgi:uncharacterized membrane protein YGL010W